MITFKMEIPRDFEDQIRRAMEDKLRERLRRDGFYNVTVRLDRDGRATFSGSDEKLKKVSESLKNYR